MSEPRLPLPAPRPPFPSWRRRVMHAAGLFGLVILTGMLASFSVMRAEVAASLAQWLVPGLRIEGSSGWLLGAWQADRIRFEQPGRVLEVEQLAVEVRDGRVMNPALSLNSLRAARVRYSDSRSDAAPAALPATLGLPLSLGIEDATIAHLEIRTGEPSRTQVLRDIAFKAFADGERLQVDRLSLAHPSLQARLNGELRLRSPYEIKAGYSAQGQEGGHAWSAAGTASGPLTEMMLAARIQSGESRARAALTLAPWRDQPLRKVELNLEEIDLRHWVSQAPRTRLTGSISLQPEGDHFKGQLHIDNAADGPLTTGRVPVRALAARLEAWTDGRIRWSDLTLAFSRQGQASGQGEWHRGTLTQALSLEQADLQAWHPDLLKTGLGGTLAFKMTAHQQTLVANVRDTQRARLTLTANLQNDPGGLQGEIALEGPQLGRAEGRLQVSAAALAAMSAAPADALPAAGRPDGQEPVPPRIDQARFAGTVSRFNLGALGRWPESRLQGTLTLAANLHGPRRGMMIVDLQDSTLAGRPFLARGQIHYSSPFRIVADLTADLAGNQLGLKGTFGDPAQSLAWTLRAENLSTLGSAFAGKAEGSGTAGGILEAPMIQGTLRVQSLRLPGQIRVEQARLEGRGGGARESALNLEGSMDRLQVGEVVLLNQARLSVEGTNGQHVARLTARNPKWQVALGLKGGWGQGLAWAGMLDRFDASGPVKARLLQPAAVLLAPARQRLGEARFDVDGGELRLEVLDRTDSTLDSRGSLTRYPVSALLPLLDPAVSMLLDSNLRLRGSWDVNWVDIPNVSADIRREEGDLTLRSTPPLRAGLSDVLLQLRSSRAGVQADVRINGSQLGELAWQADLPVAWLDRDLVISRTQPARSRLRLDIPTLRWVGPWLGPAHDIDGALQADMRLDGVWPHLRPEGQLKGEQLSYAHLTEGIAFRKGRLQARLDPGVLTLQTFSMEGGSGNFSASGRLRFDESDASGGLDWKADRLHVLNLDERTLVASGEGKVELDRGQISLTGQLRADRGAFVLDETSAPALSDDVIVYGKGPGGAPSAPARPVRLDLGLDLGNDFHLAGRGLDVRLGGRLRVNALPGQPLTTTGTLRSRSGGTYRAYGQELGIERAVLSFSGRMDNPSLDILAVRRGLPVEPGVVLSGTADRPILRLVSTPELPDGEKLSWLVLGRGSDGLDQGDRSAMLAAARTLLSQGAAASLAGSLASSLGVDAISLGTAQGTAAAGASSDVVITVGKRLSSRASLAYEQGLTGASSLIKLSYQLSRRWRVQMVTGTENAVDFFYRLAFD